MTAEMLGTIGPNPKSLLSVTTLLEAATGLLLLAAPAVVVELLLGTAPSTPIGVAGVALLALGVACWLSREDPTRRAAKGLGTAILLYNVGVVVVLVLAWIIACPRGAIGAPNAPCMTRARIAESGEDQRLNERLIRMATGEDKLSARYLHQNSFEFTPAFKLWFALNHLPDIRGQDHAIWRRVRAIPFKVTIPENKKDKKLKSRIIYNELPGVLAWIVRGFFEWQRDGLSPPAKVLAYTQAYREKVDVIAPFIDAKLVEDANGRIAGDDCLYLYQEYCADNGEIALHPNTFKKRMAARGFPGNQQWCPVKRAPVRFHVGVRAKTSDEIETQARSVEQDIEDSINSQQASLFH